MTWYDRLLIRRRAQGQSACEKLVQLGRRRFDVTLTPAELQVLNDTASSLDLPYPECTGTSVTPWTGDIRYKPLAELRA